MKRICESCMELEVEYLIKKIPKGEEIPKVELGLCGKCAIEYIKQDTASIVKISKFKE